MCRESNWDVGIFELIKHKCTFGIDGFLERSLRGLEVDRKQVSDVLFVVNNYSIDRAKLCTESGPQLISMQCSVLGLAVSHELNNWTFTKIYQHSSHSIKRRYMRQPPLIEYRTTQYPTRPCFLKSKWRNFIICFENAWQIKSCFLWVLVGSVMGYFIFLRVPESNQNFILSRKADHCVSNKFN